MKSFVISISVIASIIVFALLFSIYTCRFTKSLTDYCDEIVLKDNLDGNVTAVQKIRMHWDKHKKILGLFISKEHQRSAEFALSILEEFIYKDDSQGILYAKESFISSLDDIYFIEDRGFFSIF